MPDFRGYLLPSAPRIDGIGALIVGIFQTANRTFPEALAMDTDTKDVL